MTTFLFDYISTPHVIKILTLDNWSWQVFPWSSYLAFHKCICPTAFTEKPYHDVKPIWTWVTLIQDYMLLLTQWGWDKMNLGNSNSRLHVNVAETKWPPSWRQFQMHFYCMKINGILIHISSKFVPKGPLNNKPSLILIMAWCLTGTKPLSEPMMDSFNSIYMHDYAWMS